jgi:hypothetical protein
VNPLDKLAKILSPNAGSTAAQRSPQTIPGGIAVVTGMNPDGTISVTYNGATNVPVNLLDHFNPTIGSSVLVQAYGTQLWALGPTKTGSVRSKVFLASPTTTVAPASATAGFPSGAVASGLITPPAFAGGSNWVLAPSGYDAQAIAITSAIAIVFVSGIIIPSGAGGFGAIGFDILGGAGGASSAAISYYAVGGGESWSGSGAYWVDTLTPGINTFQPAYFTSSASAVTFEDVQLIVVPFAS